MEKGQPPLSRRSCCERQLGRPSADVGQKRKSDRKIQRNHAGACSQTLTRLVGGLDGWSCCCCCLEARSSIIIVIVFIFIFIVAVVLPILLVRRFRAPP